MIKEYLEERKEILNNIFRDNKEKYEHNQIAIAESNNQIKELNRTIDEASQIFSVKAREDNGFKNQEISNLEKRIAAYVIENGEYQKNINSTKLELSIVEQCIKKIDDYEKTNIIKGNVSRETSGKSFINNDDGGKQLNFNEFIQERSNYVNNYEIIKKLEFCKSISKIDAKRVSIELDNIISMLK